MLEPTASELSQPNDFFKFPSLPAIPQASISNKLDEIPTPTEISRVLDERAHLLVQALAADIGTRFASDKQPDPKTSDDLPPDVLAPSIQQITTLLGESTFRDADGLAGPKIEGADKSGKWTGTLFHLNRGNTVELFLTRKQPDQPNPETPSPETPSIDFVQYYIPTVPNSKQDVRLRVGSNGRILCWSKPASPPSTS